MEGGGVPKIFRLQQGGGGARRNFHLRKRRSQPPGRKFCHFPNEKEMAS